MNSTVFFSIIIIISAICIGVGIYIYNKNNNTTDDNTDVISVIDCQLSNWGEWSECQNGSKQKTRTIVTDPKNGGKECGDLSKVQACTVEGEEGDDGSITGFIKGTTSDGDDYYLNWTGKDFTKDIPGNQKSLCWNKKDNSTFRLDKNGYLMLFNYTGAAGRNSAPIYFYASYDKSSSPYRLYLKSGFDNLKLKLIKHTDGEHYLIKSSKVGGVTQFVSLYNKNARNFAVFKNNNDMVIEFVNRFGDRIEVK